MFSFYLRAIFNIIDQKKIILTTVGEESTNSESRPSRNLSGTSLTLMCRVPDTPKYVYLFPPPDGKSVFCMVDDRGEIIIEQMFEKMAA